MPRVREFLYRFRPAGAPGAASAGVPADHQADRAAELAPVFAALQTSERACARTVAIAHTEAALIRENAAAEADRIVAAASRRVPAERAAAAETLLVAARARSVELTTAAESEAAAIRARSGPRLAAAVERTVRYVGELLDETRP